ncbi:hypothetical protein ACFYRN_24985 [Streptomyces sp. NPDC005227]|uniref:hypothetical protein n=1 Tax=Streptomyces sp. NPDC005227 TaxID=3364707 RepID=UPI0036C543D3
MTKPKQQEFNLDADTGLPLPTGSEPSAAVIDVTPALARKWLRNNTHNRTVRDRAIDDYARDMVAGHWSLNGEALKFSREGAVLDGQHRLHAVVAADVTVPMMVVVGLDPTAQETMDTGRKRTTGDLMGLRGETNAHVLAAILRRVWAWDTGDFRFTGSYAATNRECAELLSERPDIRRSAEIAARTRNAFPHIPASMLGVSHHLFTRLDADETAWFFQRIGDGAELPVGHPILALRARVTSERLESLRLPEFRYLAYLIRTWNAVREGRSLDRLVHPPNSVMPQPK